MAPKTDTKTVTSPAMPTYSVDELAAAPKALGVKSPDIVRAAMKQAGKDNATVEEATEIVKKFKNKGVK